jgi:hypothetical protein
MQINPIGPAERFPDHLQTIEALNQHFRAHLEGLTSTEKGTKFSHFVQRLVPQTDFGDSFKEPVPSEKKSHDEGVDLIAEGNEDNRILYVQAKLWVDRAEALDSIIRLC